MTQNRILIRLFALLLAALLIWQFALVYIPLAQARFGADHVPGLGIDNAEARIAGALLLNSVGDTHQAAQEARKALRRAPLSQQGLFVLYDDAVASHAPASVQDRYLSLMKQLGWRFTPAQIAIIQAAEARQDYGTMVNSADSLLRRGERLEDIFDLVAALETVPSAVPAVARKVALQPYWRRTYFDALRYRKEWAEGHLAVVRYMASHHMPVSRSEMALLTNAISDAGDPARAYAIWSGLPARPFGQLADDPQAADHPASIFDWTPQTGEGQGVYTQQVDGGEAVAINWNGKGSPLFMWKVVPLTAAPHRLFVQAVPSSGTDLSRLQFAIRCGDVWVPLSTIKSGDGQAVYGPVSLSDVHCAYPRLEVSGVPQIVDRPANFLIRSLRFR